MARFSSVLAFANKIKTECDRLDIAVLNAGILHMKFHSTPDGWEEVLQVNVIATGLLAVLLLPKLAETANVASLLAEVTLRPHLLIVSSVGTLSYYVKLMILTSQDTP
jgi:retinol dehydrogenase 12